MTIRRGQCGPWRACLLLAVAWGACSTKEEGGTLINAGGNPSTRASGGAPQIGGTGATTAAGPAVVGAGGQPTIRPSDNAAGASGAEDPDTCAAAVQTAKQLPLDLYIMLDISDSMNELAGDTSKWDAVKTALTEFLNAPESDGIGVGIQYFPLPGRDVPDSCTTHAECGPYGPCFISFCKGAAGVVACASDDDCRTAEDDFGPCAPLSFCASAFDLQICSDNSDCFGEGPCTPMHECSASGNICATVGQRCGNNGGVCQAELHSVCSNPFSCDAEDYAMPAVSIAALPAAASGVVRSISAQTPTGTTPTSPALKGALAQAQSFASAHPDHTVATLLATDGLPTLCIDDKSGDPGGIRGVEQVAATGARTSPSVPTFVIGVFAPDEREAHQNLDRIAQAGGTERAFIVETSGNVTAQFLEALNAIRGSRLSCEYQLPEAPSGQVLDFSLINVDFTASGKTTRLSKVNDASECDATGGWYYDVNPTRSASPTRILVCDSTCQTFKASTDAKVSIALGCETQIK